MELTIDCTLPMEDIHNRFAEALDFPWWYGKNLDALYALLTALSADVTIPLLNPELQPALVRVLTDAAEENPHLTLG